MEIITSTTSRTIINPDINDGGGSTGGLHVVMFPFLAYGHINPFINLALKLSAADPTIHVTFLTTPANVPRIFPSFRDVPSVSVRSIPLPSVPGLPPGAESTADLTHSQAELLKIAVDNMKPDVQSFLLTMSSYPSLSPVVHVVVVFDFAQPWIPSIASPLGIKSLFFSVFSALSTAYLTVPSRGRTCRRCDADADIDDIVQLLRKPPPGFPTTSSIAAAGGVPTYQARDFSYVFKAFGEGQPCVYDRVTTCMESCTAIIAKTCTEMEGQYISYAESEYGKPMLQAGPVVPEPPPHSNSDGMAALEERWAKWLDRWEKGTVIYCAFGSETQLKDQGQVRELLLGLEMTGLPFFAVLNYPDDQEAILNSIRAEYSSGFEDRGVIHRGWVQQQLILQHQSVGCMLSHVGFSTVVEGLLAGCRLVMLPLRGDQYLNSALFARDLGIGVEVERDEITGDFTRRGICEAIKKATGDQDAELVKNHGKWREFFTDKGMELRFMVDFVAKLKALVTRQD